MTLSYDRRKFYIGQVDEDFLSTDSYEVAALEDLASAHDCYLGTELADGKPDMKKANYYMKRAHVFALLAQTTATAEVADNTMLYG